MIPDDPEELNALAGEYVLGMLDAAQAHEIAAALAGNAALRRAVIFWEERLQPLAALAPPADPPADTWSRIAKRIDAAEPAAKIVPLWDRAAPWRWATVVSSALAACLILYIAFAPAVRGPSFVAVLHPPQTEQAAWVATAGGNGLLVRAVATTAAPSDRDFELWAIAPGASRPQALGIIPPDGRLKLGVLPAAIREGGTLAISIEPKGGSPTGQPTGPVVFSGPLVAAR